VVLFDEIEKAAPSVTRLLLGILDKATLRLGDNTEVNFERSLIFFTSNLGAREMLKEINPDFGFRTAVPPNWKELAGRLENIALAAVRKMYSPEFVNRIDAVITYQPLDKESFAAILDQHITELQKHVNTRLGNRCFHVEVPEESRQFLLERGTSPQYGARELKRTIHRYLTQPLATLVIENRIEPGSCVRVDLSEDGRNLLLHSVASYPVATGEHPTILIVDDNQALLRLLAEHLKANTGWRVLTVETLRAAQDIVNTNTPDLILLDYLVPDGNGVRLGVDLKLRFPSIQGIIMTGAELPDEEEEICRQFDFRIVHKPFLAGHILNLMRERLFRASTAAR
jgi:CheY-like chemotaxis protein